MKQAVKKTIKSIQRQDDFKCFVCNKLHPAQTHEQLKWLNDFLPKNCVGLFGTIKIVCVKCGAIVEETSFGRPNPKEAHTGTTGNITEGMLVSFTH